MDAGRQVGKTKQWACCTFHAFGDGICTSFSDLLSSWMCSKSRVTRQGMPPSVLPSTASYGSEHCAASLGTRAKLLKGKYLAVKSQDRECASSIALDIAKFLLKLGVRNDPLPALHGDSHHGFISLTTEALGLCPLASL